MIVEPCLRLTRPTPPGPPPLAWVRRRRPGRATVSQITRDVDAWRGGAARESRQSIRHLLALEYVHATPSWGHTKMRSTGFPRECRWSDTPCCPRATWSYLAATARISHGEADHELRFTGDCRHPCWPRRKPRNHPFDFRRHSPSDAHRASFSSCVSSRPRARPGLSSVWSMKRHSLAQAWSNVSRAPPPLTLQAWVIALDVSAREPI